MKPGLFPENELVWACHSDTAFYHTQKLNTILIHYLTIVFRDAVGYPCKETLSLRSSPGLYMQRIKKMFIQRRNIRQLLINVQDDPKRRHLPEKNHVLTKANDSRCVSYLEFR